MECCLQNNLRHDILLLAFAVSFVIMLSVYLIFTARCYASAVLAVIVSLSVPPSVRLSVRLSQFGVVRRWLNL